MIFLKLIFDDIYGEALGQMLTFRLEGRGGEDCTFVLTLSPGQILVKSTLHQLKLAIWMNDW